MPRCWAGGGTCSVHCSTAAAILGMHCGRLAALAARGAGCRTQRTSSAGGRCRGAVERGTLRAASAAGHSGRAGPPWQRRLMYAAPGVRRGREELITATAECHTYKGQRPCNYKGRARVDGTIPSNRTIAHRADLAKPGCGVWASCWVMIAAGCLRPVLCHRVSTERSGRG